MLRFPSPEDATEEGLLAIGGDLQAETLLMAYRQGIFPWYMPGQPILWWSPDPRMVLYPDALRVSRSLARLWRHHPYEIRFDTAFTDVMRACRDVREAGESWIDEAMIAAYTELHALGHGHSVEVWQGDKLVGGLYGIAIGRVFFGESMFHRHSNASKLALVALVDELKRRDFALIDCQIRSAHLASLGAIEIERRKFLALLDRYCSDEAMTGGAAGH